MPTKVILGERNVWLCQDPREAAENIGYHLQLAKSQGKAHCEFKEVPLLDTTWQQVFGIECISCEEHPVSFFVPAGYYLASERLAVLGTLRFVVNSFITGVIRREDIYEKLLKDDLL